MSDINEKLDKLDNKLNSINITLVKQQGILDVHVKRTDLLESQIVPIQEFKTELNGIIRFFKFLGIIAAIIEGIYQIKHWYN